MNIVGFKLILLVCALEICKSFATTENVTPSKHKENPFADEKKDSIDKDKFHSMENVIKFEKWMVINSK